PDSPERAGRTGNENRSAIGQAPSGSLNYEYPEPCPWGIGNTSRPEPYCLIPFLLPPPKNPCPTTAEKTSQAGRRRFDPGRPLLMKPSATPRVSFGWVVASRRS